MPNPIRALIRSSAFWGKEVLEVLRQPRMIFMLVLGPFLILLLFGIGYQNKPPTFRTLFVAPPDSSITQNIQQYVSALGPQFIFEGVTPDQQQALDRLHRGEVDLVAVAPANAVETIQSNHQAIFTIYSDEIDPYRASWTQYYAYVYVNEVNRRVLQNVVSQGQGDATKLQKDIQTAHTTATQMREALQRGDQATANQSQQQLSSNIDDLALAMGAGFAVMSGVSQAAGGGSSDQSSQSVLQALTDAQQNTNALNSQGSESNQTKIQQLTSIENDLSHLESNLNKFTSMDPGIIVTPFWNKTENIIPTPITPVDFYAPAVLALLLQHLAVTLAALSIVRERTLGTLELFRVSPLSAGEALFGKYISYFLFTGIIGAILLALMVFGLHVPLLGNLWNVIIVMAAVLFASLSIGFFISLISRTDSQAVQMTMLVLLTSVFFSGFILTLDQLLAPARVVSGLMPVTYGIQLLRDIMLRGQAPDVLLLTALAVLGLVFFIIAWRMMHRLISRSI